jgi:hypothetical protein
MTVLKILGGMVVVILTPMASGRDPHFFRSEEAVPGVLASTTMGRKRFILD